MLPVKKIFIDSRYKTTDSASNSDFKIELPTTLQLPDGCVFYLTNFVIPHSWKNVEPGINDTMYLVVGHLTSGQPTTYFSYKIILDSENYNGSGFAIEVNTKMNAAENIFDVIYDLDAHTFTIHLKAGITNRTFKILTDDDLRADSLSSFPGTDKNRLNSVNFIIKNTEKSIWITSDNYYICDFLDLTSIRNIYINSSNLGNLNSTLGPRSYDTTIIHKVPVTADYGYIIINDTMNANDYIDCSGQTLKTISFTLTNSAGYTIPLHNSPISFSIVFSILG